MNQLLPPQFLDYPKSRVTDAIDECAGVILPDAYHWLEAETDEVRDWQRAQGRIASEFVRRWPYFDALSRSVAGFSIPSLTFIPRNAGGLWFRMEAPTGAAMQARAIVAHDPLGDGRVLFDPAAENPAAPPFLSWIAPSPDGRVLALGVCTDGSENNTIRLVDVATGQRLADAPTQVLMDNWLGGVQWLGDSSGFYFTALAGSAHDFQQRVFLHRLGEPAPSQPVDLPETTSPRDYRAVCVCASGRWAVLIQRLFNPLPVAVLDLTERGSAWRPFVTDLPGTVAGHIVGDDYVAATDVGAPRGRVVAIPLDSKTPNQPESWREIVPESEAVIRGVTLAGGRFYLSELVDTYARVRIVDVTGAALGEVPLPGRGSIGELPFPMMPLFQVSPTACDDYIFSFSTLTVSAGMYRHKFGAAALETLAPPEVTIENAIIEDHWAVSADGTHVPYHSVRLKSVDLASPHPALIWAYGGFNIPWKPQFPGATAAFVAAGGVLVYAHIRGGAELGLAWWHGGRLKNKQNCYADLYAIAEDLIAKRVTEPERLGITGGSNGGLLAGVAVTQRPDLWSVAIPRAPLLDVIGACRDPYGRACVSFDYGDPDDPDEVRRMADFSPYQLVKDGVVYPAVFVDAGDTDPRCPPWHSRKFVARLQAAQGGSAPILLRIWDNVGHGGATAKNIQIEQNTEWLAFAMQRFGMTPPAT